MTSTLSQSLLSQARRCLGAGDFEEARAILAPFANLQDGPSSGNASLIFWREAGTVLRDAGMAEAADRVWARACDEGMPRCATEIQSIYSRLVGGSFEDALPRARAIYEEFSGNVMAANLYALVLFECGRRNDALEEWERSRKISAQKQCPLSTYPLYLSLGAMAFERFLAETEEPERPPVASVEPTGKAPGRSAQKRAEAIEKALIEGRNNEAMRWIDAEGAGGKSDPVMIGLLKSFALGESGRWQEVREELVPLLEPPQVVPTAQVYFAYSLVRSGEARLALSLLDTVVPAGPDDYFANYFRGSAWRALGDRPRALRSFQSAFTDYFFDTYHGRFIPMWGKVVRLVLSV